jgi:RNA polymerase sigma-70 factor (ECF subfamily)
MLIMRNLLVNHYSINSSFLLIDSPKSSILFFQKRNIINEDSLDQIIMGCLQEREDAQRLLFKQFFGYAKSIALRYSSNDIEAQEIINDGFLKVFKNLNHYDFAQPFKAWLRTIVINTSIDYYRRKQKYAIMSFPEQLPDATFDDNVLDKISADEIMVLVRQLSPAYRTVFMMYVIDGYNHREIGEMLNINEGTSKSNLAKARAKLQDLILESNPSLYYAYAKNK